MCVKLIKNSQPKTVRGIFLTHTVVCCKAILAQGLIFRAYRHGRAWWYEFCASRYGNPCLKFWECLIISATSEPLRVG